MSKDIGLSDACQPVIQGGDFLVEDDTLQRVQLITAIANGEFKQHPVVGINHALYVYGSGGASQLKKLKRDIRTQLETDGFNRVDVKGQSADGIIIDLEQPKN